MKKLFLILEVVLILVLFLGCTDSPSENPEKISFSYSSGAMHLDWGSFEVSVDSSGNGILLKKMGMSMELQKTFSLSQEEMKEVFNTASKNGFFSLNDSYDDPFVMDGGWSKISISTDSSTKTVSMYNYSLQQFSTVESKIASLVNEKLGANAFDLSEFRDYCPQKETECKNFIMSDECNPENPSEVNEDCFICLDWWDYCGWEE